MWRRDDVGKSVEILSDILLNSKFEESAIERERDVILREQEGSHAAVACHRWKANEVLCRG